MNGELVKKALEKVGNSHVLINLVSRRVRQLNAGGAAGRPLIRETPTLGAADIALTEIIEGKMGFEMPEIIELTRPTGHNRKKPPGWGKPPTKSNGDIPAAPAKASRAERTMVS